MANKSAEADTAYAEALKRIEVCRLERASLLDLSEMRLTSSPVEIGQLTALTVLLLNSNQLTSLPVEIGQLTALTALDLGSNQLTSLPVEIGQLTALKECYLHENPQLGIPDSVLGPRFVEVHAPDETKRKSPARPADIFHFYFSRQT